MTNKGMVVVATVQSYQLNNRVVDVDLAQVRELSDPSKNILTNLGANLPQAFQTVAPLADRIHSMDETAQMLRETKDNSTRDKIIAFLKTALVVALVAGVITACVFGGELGLAAGIIFGFFAYMFLTVFLYCNSAEKIENVEKRLPNYSKPWYFPDLIGYDPRAFFPLLGGGLVMPLFEAYTKESRLERVLRQQRESIDATLSDYKNQNNQVLPLAYQFFKDQSQGLLDGLNHKIEQSERSLADMERLSERSAAGENELRARIAAHQKARDELNVVAAFYRQFDAL